MKKAIEIIITVNAMVFFFFCYLDVLCSPLSLFCACFCTVFLSVSGVVFVNSPVYDEIALRYYSVIVHEIN